MISPRWLPLLCLLLTGCERKPIWFGIWDIESVELDGDTLQDAGFLEVGGDASVALFLRYTWSPGAGFAPDPAPRIVLGDTNARSQSDPFDSFREKDEVYDLLLSPFQTIFLVEDYDIERAVLRSDAAVWPGRPESDARPAELVLVR